MTHEDVPRILEEVTQEILARMRRDGFTVTDDGPVRYDPITWDINNGRCEEWAELASEKLEGPSFTQWIDPYHCVLFYRGLWYDADRPDGVVDWENLPMIADPGMDRPEPLPGRKEGMPERATVTVTVTRTSEYVQIDLDPEELLELKQDDKIGLIKVAINGQVVGLFQRFNPYQSPN